VLLLRWMVLQEPDGLAATTSEKDEDAGEGEESVRERGGVSGRHEVFSGLRGVESATHNNSACVWTVGWGTPPPPHPPPRALDAWDLHVPCRHGNTISVDASRLVSL
jgi:hypothetical protein